MFGFGAGKAHSGTTVSTEHHASQTVRVCSVRKFFRIPLAQTLCFIPCFLVDDSLMGVFEYDPFFRGCSTALFQLEVLTDTFT